MFDNVLHEIPYVQQLYTEYLTQIKRYQNYKRNSIFCRYYNINLDASNYNSTSEGTFDRYNSGIFYDIYDYTPLQNINPIINESSNDIQMFGQKFSTITEITTYTISNPKIEDLIVFNNLPNDGSEIFRVSNIRASINSMNSNPNIKYFQNTIEYAPIVDLSKLKILNHYVYSLPMEKYLLHDDFLLFIKNIETFNIILNKFQNKYFDDYQELYFICINGIKEYPKYENKLIYDFLAYRNFLTDQFCNIKRPYTITDILEQELKTDILNEKYYNFYQKKCNSRININNLDVDYNYNIFEICDLIIQWIWYYNFDKYSIKNDAVINDDLGQDINDTNLIFNNNGIICKNGPKTNLYINIRKLNISTIESMYECLR